MAFKWNDGKSVERWRDGQHPVRTDLAMSWDNAGGNEAKLMLSGWGLDVEMLVGSIKGDVRDHQLADLLGAVAVAPSDAALLADEVVKLRSQVTALRKQLETAKGRRKVASR